MNKNITDESKRKIMDTVFNADHNLESELTVAFLAQHAGMSEKHFQRCFRAIINESPKNYIRRLRIQRAAYMLKWSDAQIIDIAMYSGFDSPGGFSKAFIKAFGCPPKEFRDNQQVVPYMYRSPQSNESKNDEALLEVRALNVRIETSPAFRLAAMRYIGPVEKMASIWPVMIKWIKKHHLFDENTIVMGIHNDLWDEHNKDRYRYDAAVVVPEDFEGDNEVSLINIPSGSVAITEYQGSLAQADQTWNRFVNQWLPISGYTFREQFAYDIYPLEMMSPNALRQLVSYFTGITASFCIPISKKVNSPYLWG